VQCLPGGDEREDGSTVWKTRTLQRMGYQVVRISFREWDEAEARGEVDSFLREKLVGFFSN